jgi:hypothetical protein
MTQFPRFSHEMKGALLLVAGIVLFLYVTNIITAGLQMVILLASLVLMVFGFTEMDGYHKLMKLIKKK